MRRYVGQANDTALVMTRPGLVALAVAVCSLGLLGSAQEVLAEDQTGSTQSSSSPQQSNAPALQEIIVTATFKPEPLQKLPEAVTAITSKQLQELNAQTFEDYFRTVPGLMMNTDGGGLNRFDFSLRGVSDFTQFAPLAVKNATVGQYLDEIPVTAVGQQIDPRLVDVDRVEVLRGPQGTYFGEDSLGGTIRIISQKPDLERFAATVDSRVSQTRYGSTNDSESMMVNLPLFTNILGFRANYFNADDSGFIRGVTAGCTAMSCDVTGIDSKHNNPDRSNGGRAMLLYQPTERISLLAEFIHSDYIQRNTASYEPKVGDLDIIQDDTNTLPGTGGGGGGTTSGGGGTTGGGGSTTGGGGSTTGGGGSTTGGGGGTTGGGGSTTGGGGGGGTAPPGDFSPTDIHDQDNLYNVTVQAGAGPVDVVSATSWGYRTLLDSTPTPGSSVFNGTFTYYDSFTQELRVLNSDGWSDHWSYVVGAYLQRQNEAQTEVSPGAPNGAITQYDKETAEFGDVGYSFNQHLTARVGVRQETVDFSGVFRAPAAPAEPDVATGRNSPTTWRVVGSYQFNSNAMAYSSISTGFRKGGANPSIDTRTGQAIPGVPEDFKPDSDTDYEIGWKFTFPTHRATLNGDIFHIDWRDIQVAQVTSLLAGGTQQYFTNSGAAKVDGLELEGAMQLVTELTAQMSVALMNPVITEGQPGTTCEHGCPARPGDQIPFDSHVTGSATLVYRHPIGGGGKNGFVSFNEQFTGPRNTDFSALTPSGAQNPFFREMTATWLTNVQFGIAGRQWRASLYANNLFDRRNMLSITPNGGPFPNGDEVLVDRPLTVGLWLQYSFH